MEATELYMQRSERERERERERKREREKHTRECKRRMFPQTIGLENERY